jgi:hypothetical protein
MAKGAQREVVSFLITQEHITLRPASGSGGVLLAVLWQEALRHISANLEA